MTTNEIIRSYGADPAIVTRAGAIIFGYSGGAISAPDALAIITVGTETGSLDDAHALARAYWAAHPPMGPYWHPGDEA